MSVVYESPRSEQMEIQRKLVQGTARLCSTNFGRAWKGIFPHKPAEELAARVGCTIRTASYELSGERHPSAQSIKALMDVVVPPWK
jgi:transcriptional regulator with XRE-family HTH domain